MGRQPRQRAVSCHFCRTRKLRCSRDFPCTNCTSRGVQCEEPRDPPRAAPAQRPIAKKTTGVSSTLSSESDILGRLERLEALVAGRNNQVDVDFQGTPPVVAQASSERTAQDTSTKSQNWQQQLPSSIQNLTADALWLERSCLYPKLRTSALTDTNAFTMVFRPCPIRLITQSSSYVFQNTSVPATAVSLEPIKCIWLPNRDETKVLVTKYTTEITYMHHIIHGPSMHKLVDDVYDAIDQGATISLPSIFLLLSVCANVTYAWTEADNDATALFAGLNQANDQAVSWLKGAMDVFDVAQRKGQISLESAQGLIIVSFVLFNTEGVSTRARMKLFQAITICRELGLHRLDYPHNLAPGHANQYTRLQAEVARRVWWYLVGIDCMLARFPGPHEGTYILNRQHMAVRKPLHINDEDLVDDREVESKPLDQPTHMSYYLQRIRLAELMRMFTDKTPLQSSTLGMIDYDLVLELDEAIDRFLEETPSFFFADATQLGKLPKTDILRTPAMSVQRHIMKIFVHGQRCKLHLPYLARGAVEPRYSRSRDVCLETARLIIQAEQQLTDDSQSFSFTRLRLAMVLHGVFLANIVLLLDLCQGVTEEEKKTRLHELVKAWAVLEEAQEHSGPTERILDLLRQVMRKHRIPVPVIKKSTRSQARPRDREAALPLTPSSGAGKETIAVDGPNESSFSEAGLVNEDLNLDLGDLNWEGLLWGLDAPFM